MANSNLKGFEKQFGVTPPFSMDLASCSEIKENKHLVETLQSYDIFEEKDVVYKQQVILACLTTLVNNWSENVGLLKDERSNYVRVIPFGSYRLGVNNKGSDIDALCLAPFYVSREDFFSTLPSELKKHPGIKYVHPIENCYVPLLKIDCDGIKIDLLFVKLSIGAIRDSLDITSDMVLHGLDNKDMRSLSGVRNTEEILNLVPNVTNFQLALRAVKLWATSKYRHC